MATQFVELRGATFAYSDSGSDSGSGPIVISAHGLTSSRANEQRTGLSDYSTLADAGFRVISYDARGHGESSGGANPAEYTWRSLAADFLAIAEHFSPGEPVIAIGLSMGTGTIAHAVIERPDRFSRLVLSAPPTAWETRAGQTAMYSMMADTVETSTPEVLAELLTNAPPAPIFADVEGFPPPPDVSAALLPSVFRGAGMSDLPSLEELAGIAIPTLILAWATDPGHPVSTAEKLVETIPDSELRIAKTSADIAGWGDRAATFLGR
jgi:3-oxoadipate enol-lactonase